MEELKTFLFATKGDLAVNTFFSVKVVARTVLKDRHTECGYRARWLLSRAIVTPGARMLNWDKGVYTVVWEDDDSVAKKAVHIGGDSARIPEDWMWTRSAKVVNNFSDWDAALVNERGRMLPIHSLFEPDISSREK